MLDDQHRPILKTQANEVLEMIQDNGLDPGDFAWGTFPSYASEGLTVSRLTHRPTGYYFLFDFTGQGLCCVRSPGRGLPLDQQNPGDWHHQRVYVHEWVQEVAKEHAAPSLWAAVGSQHELVEAAIGAEDNEPLNEEHRGQARSVVKELRAYVRDSFDLSEDQVQHIDARFDYLEGAIERMGRRDWLHTFVGVLFTMAVGAALAPQQTAELFRIAGHLLRVYFNVQGVLPAP